MSSRAIVVPTVEALLNLLEAEEFYCDVSIASSAQAFYRRLSGHPLTLQVTELIQINPDYAGIVLGYADRLARSTHGSVRSENDAALCACLVALDHTAVRGFDDLLRYLQNSRELALRWAAELADILSGTRVSTIQTVTALTRPRDSILASMEGLPMGLTRTPTGAAQDNTSHSLVPRA
jgi:hypothetical protein